MAIKWKCHHYLGLVVMAMGNLIYVKQVNEFAPTTYIKLQGCLRKLYFTA